MYLAVPENSPELVTGWAPGNIDANRSGEDLLECPAPPLSSHYFYSSHFLRTTFA